VIIVVVTLYKVTRKVTGLYFDGFEVLLSLGIRYIFPFVKYFDIFSGCCRSFLMQVARVL